MIEIDLDLLDKQIQFVIHQINNLNPNDLNYKEKDDAGSSILTYLRDQKGVRFVPES